ncbi:MAG: hypothetical protein VKO39_12625 [Cyanobacteriota bacterium]|nr:hypothetical protein [Cyanobacteriota bacterium]
MVIPVLLLAFRLASPQAVEMAQAPTVDPEPSSPSGQFFLGGAPLASLAVENIIWTGDCPGEQMQGYGPVDFLAVAVPPAPGQRVLIRNLSTGGYTNREYNEKRMRSEGFYVSIGQGQHGSFLSLAPGINSFNWSVSSASQSQVIGSGAASLNVEVRQTQRNRSFTSYKEDTYCINERTKTFRTTLDKCPEAYYTLERIGICPDGTRKTLSFQTLRRVGFQPMK